MNKKIRAIEVLNEMANNESYRPTVKYKEMTYTYHYDIGDYTNDFNSEYGIFSGWALNLMLNDEVEILEDNTEEIEELKYDVVDENGRGWYKLDTIADKVTELIKSVNAIRKDIKNG